MADGEDSGRGRAPISLCLIARDEEGSLERCLRSAAGVVDEVCVLDTGSKDGTPALAARLGARVDRFEWRDDFAAARNRALSMARSDWILVLDADEELAGEPADLRARLLRFAWAQRGKVGRLEIENRGREGTATRAAVSRFLPNDGLHSFHGRVHEQVVVLDGETLREPARADVGLRVVHHGYELDPEARQRKLARNARLLEAALQETPGDGYLWYQLGRTRSLGEQHAAAVEALERALERCPDGAPWGIHALETGAYSLRAVGRSQQALALVDQVGEHCRARADTCFLRALLALDLGRAEDAEHGFRRCLELGGPGAEGAPEADGAAESSPSASTWAPAYNLGVICEFSGRGGEAQAWYERALAANPAHAPSKKGLERLAAS